MTRRDQPGHHFCCPCCIFPFARRTDQNHRDDHREIERETHRGSVRTMHKEDMKRVPDFIHSQWPQPPPAGKVDMNSFVTWAVSTTLRSTVVLFAIGPHSVFTLNTYSRNKHNPWLISQDAQENRALAQHIAEKWQEMQGPNDQRDRVDQIAKHVSYEYDRGTKRFNFMPLEFDGMANVRVRIKDINIWSHPPRDDPLRRVLLKKPYFKQEKGNLKHDAAKIKRICENRNIPTDRIDERLQSQKSIVRRKFKEYYHKYFCDFCGLDSSAIPVSYQFPTLQLSQGQRGDQPDRYGNAMAGVYGANDDEAHHKFSASGIPRLLPSEEEVFDNWLEFPCGLTYAELFQGEFF